AHRLLFEAPDACEDDAIAGFERLAELHRQAGDAEREARARKEAADMRALSVAQRTYAFLSNAVGHPALLVHDPGGLFFLGVHRRTGLNVIWRMRRLKPDEPALPPPVRTSPYILEALAVGTFQGR